MITSIGLGSQVAAAQPRAPTKAESIFREGREAATRGDMEAACAKFDESVRLARSAGPLMNLADCEERKGRLVSAAKLWQEALQRLDAGDDRRSFAIERAGALDKRLPRLTVRVSPDASDAQVAIDGAPVPPGDARAPLPVDPGDHRVSVRAGGRAGSAAVTVTEGERREVIVALAAEGAAMKPSPEPSSGGALRTAGFIAGGVGLAGLAVFGVTAGLIEGRRATVREACNEAKQCTPEGLDAAESGRALIPVNTAGFVVGVVGLGAGVTLILLSPSRSKPAVALRAGGGPGAFSASLSGRF